MAMKPADGAGDVEATNADAAGHARVGETADRPSVAVVEAVERATGERPEPGALYRTVDPDALDLLFAGGPDGPARDEGALRFVLGDCIVAVRADGEVTAATR